MEEKEEEEEEEVVVVEKVEEEVELVVGGPEGERGVGEAGVAAAEPTVTVVMASGRVMLSLPPPPLLLPLALFSAGNTRVA